MNRNVTREEFNREIDSVKEHIDLEIDAQFVQASLIEKMNRRIAGDGSRGLRLHEEVC